MRLAFLTVAAVLLVAAGCATLTERRVQRLDELAGVWECSISGASGTQPGPRLVVRPDGAYVATGGGMTIQGRFGVTGAGLRFESDLSTGTGRVLEKDGQLILRTRRDDGSGTAECRKTK